MSLSGLVGGMESTVSEFGDDTKLAKVLEQYCCYTGRQGCCSEGLQQADRNLVTFRSDKCKACT